MPQIENPILRGFHPDPAIIRVGNTFYIANSTFEWFPGVEIWSSTNLCDWTFCTRPLNRVSQLDMRGVPSSGGVWAPCLTYADNQFWLIYTINRNWKTEQGAGMHLMDTPNFLVTAPTIEGPWSDPIYLNSSGFDPSLFHDNDGRKWLVNMRWDWRPGHNPFSGIVLQEYSHTEKKLVGPVECIFRGTELGCTEGPHLYVKDGEYWLLVAEGGTSYMHAATIARSNSLHGPYTPDPAGPLVAALPVEVAKDLEKHWQHKNIDIDPAHLPPHFYQMPHKTGHGSLCQVQGDDWVLAHLMGRPLTGTTHCPLGRETGLQPVTWKKHEWPHLTNKKVQMTVECATPSAADGTSRALPNTSPNTEAPLAQNMGTLDEQFTATLDYRWQSLRIPSDTFVDLTTRPGWIRLYGRESMQSKFDVSLIACRVSSTTMTAETVCQFHPHHFQQQAGIILRYDEYNQLYCGSYYDQEEGCHMVGVSAFDGGALSASYEPLPAQYIDPSGATLLGYKVEINARDIRFYWSGGKNEYVQCGGVYDSAKLSDEYASPMGFTGQFVGIFCMDLSGGSHFADFNYFKMY